MFASFGHLGGYSSAYYTYMWSLVIAKDLFSAFDPDDLFEPDRRRPLPRPRARPRRLPRRRRPGRRLPRPPVHLRRVRRLAGAVGHRSRNRLARGTTPAYARDISRHVGDSTPAWRGWTHDAEELPVGHRGFGRQWAHHAEQQWQQHQRGGGWGGPPWAGFGPGGFGRPGQPGPAAVGGRPVRPGAGRAAARPPGPPRRRALGDPRRGPHRAVERRADQRLPGDPADRRAQQRRLAAEPRARSTRRSSSSRTRACVADASTPAAGAALRLTEAGQAVRRRAGRRARGGVGAVRGAGARRRRRAAPTSSPEIGQVMGAVWQIVTTGSDQQRRAAVDVLVEPAAGSTAILADGDPEEPDGGGERREGRPAADRGRRARAGRRRARRALRAGPDHGRGARRAAGPDLGGAHPGRPRAGVPRPAWPARAGWPRRRYAGPARPGPWPGRCCRGRWRWCWACCWRSRSSRTCRCVLVGALVALVVVARRRRYRSARPRCG